MLCLLAHRFGTVVLGGGGGVVAFWDDALDAAVVPVDSHMCVTSKILANPPDAGLLFSVHLQLN